MAVSDYEKLGVFYLGKSLSSDQTTLGGLELYDSKDLTTHGVIVGMTGSGKTGLAIDLLEEAAIYGIPVIAIDPKGDLGNLALTFPQLRPEDFQPWVDPAEAVRRGQSIQEAARETAANWKKGLADWDQPPERIQSFRDKAEVVIYTPGSQAGIPLRVLQSFDPPSDVILKNAEAFRERVQSATAGLLALLGIDADPIRSREQILIANLMDRAWRDGKSVTLPSLIRDLQKPPFDKVGVLDIDSFFPAKDRFELAMSLNNLLASPGFSAWMEGEPLDIPSLLYGPNGQPRISILSIAHLSDSERMFFVTILLNELVAWVRAQSGTSSLRALLYMDEVFGYFPPTANPPSKVPMLTLLKQARAFGVGVLLATQNPVDLDYKGLSNCGTWFIGRLQTERDKLRVLDGLEGASTAAGKSFDRAKMEATISGLGKRIFLMNNVHDEAPVLFQTRWSLSYLRGPITREQIALLMNARKAANPVTAPASSSASSDQVAAAASDRPVLPPGIPEFFLPLRRELPGGAQLIYQPALFGLAKVRFVQAATGIDVGQSLCCLTLVEGDLPADPWEEADTEAGEPVLEKSPHEHGQFATLPSELANARKFASLTAALRDHLYRVHRLKVWRNKEYKIVSAPDEAERDVRQRFAQTIREMRDLAVEKLRATYAPKFRTLEDQIRRAEQRVASEKEQGNQQMLSTALGGLATMASILLGNKKLTATNVSKVTTTAKQAGRVLKERGDLANASETKEVVQQRMQELNAALETEIAKLQERFDPESIGLEEIQLQPKKTDISVTRVALVWQPTAIGTDGTITDLSTDE